MGLGIDLPDGVGVTQADMANDYFDLEEMPQYIINRLEGKYRQKTAIKPSSAEVMGCAWVVSQ